MIGDRTQQRDLLNLHQANWASNVILFLGMLLIRCLSRTTFSVETAWWYRVGRQGQRTCTTMLNL